MNVCKVNDCDKKVKGHGLCPMHLRRFRLYGNVHKTNKKVKQICLIEGCNNYRFGKGYCGRHYQRFIKYGDPLFTQIGRDKEFHGLRNTPEYEVWAGMKARCFNPKHVGYKRYGGRGITVCDRWKNSFINFLKDMGKRPEGDYQIDRENNLGNYEPSNCRWVSYIENNQNRRSTKLSMMIATEIRSRYKKENISHRELADSYNVHKSAITALLNNKTWKELL